MLVNKMDDPTVKWDKTRYDEITTKLSPFLKQWGYNVEKGTLDHCLHLCSYAD